MARVPPILYGVKLKEKGGTLMTTEDFIIELFCRVD
ncbi:MAG: hypothetical protein DFNUSKGM_002163, partial [Candidatus Fervidibacter sacchari]